MGKKLLRYFGDIRNQLTHLKYFQPFPKYLKKTEIFDAMRKKLFRYVVYSSNPLTHLKYFHPFPKYLKKTEIFDFLFFFEYLHCFKWHRVQIWYLSIIRYCLFF